MGGALRISGSDYVRIRRIGYGKKAKKIELQQCVAFERFDLRLVEDFFEFAPVEFADSFDRSGCGEEFFARRGTESGELFQYVLFHRFRTGFPIERDGEPVGFVAEVHDDGQFGAALGEFHALFVRFGEDFLFSLGEGCEEGKWRDRIGTCGNGNGFRILADGLRRR